MTGRVLRRMNIVVSWVNGRSMTNPPHGQAQTLPAGIRIGPATREECLEATADPNLDMTREFVEQAFSRDSFCVAAFHDGRMVSYAWRASRCAPHTGTVVVRVDADSSYGFKALTLPAYRGLGIYPAIARAEVALCRARGLDRGVSFTDIDNLASIKADVKFGNEIIGLAGIAKLGRTTVAFHDAAVRRSGFRFVVSQSASDV